MKSRWKLPLFVSNLIFLLIRNRKNFLSVNKAGFPIHLLCSDLEFYIVLNPC